MSSGESEVVVYRQRGAEDTERVLRMAALGSTPPDDSTLSGTLLPILEEPQDFTLRSAPGGPVRVRVSKNQHVPSYMSGFQEGMRAMERRGGVRDGDQPMDASQAKGQEEGQLTSPVQDDDGRSNGTLSLECSPVHEDAPMQAPHTGAAAEDPVHMWHSSSEPMGDGTPLGGEDEHMGIVLLPEHWNGEGLNLDVDRFLHFVWTTKRSYPAFHDATLGHI